MSDTRYQTLASGKSPYHIPAATLFPLGPIHVTANALRRLSPQAISEGLSRHASGDWGNVCPEDAEINIESADSGNQILSAYGEGHKKFWIITGPGGSGTAVLLPEDY